MIGLEDDGMERVESWGKEGGFSISRDSNVGESSFDRNGSSWGSEEEVEVEEEIVDNEFDDI